MCPERTAVPRRCNHPLTRPMRAQGRGTVTTSHRVRRILAGPTRTQPAGCNGRYDMNDKQTESSTPAGFKRPRLGGRQPGSLNKRTKAAIEICESYDFHPVATLITVITTGKLPNADGTFADVDTPGRMDALKSLCPYVLPRLAQTALTGKDAGPLAVATLDMTRILADPALVLQAQNLSLAMTDADREPAPARIYTAGDTNFLE